MGDVDGRAGEVALGEQDRVLLGVDGAAQLGLAVDGGVIVDAPRRPVETLADHPVLGVNDARPDLGGGILGPGRHELGGGQVSVVPLGAHARISKPPAALWASLSSVVLKPAAFLWPPPPKALAIALTS